MSFLSEEQFEETKKRLRKVEAQYGVRVLYASEVGSQVRGTGSADSDYDVRFIYVQPLANYLRLSPGIDEITVPQEDLWDIRGKDLRALLVELIEHKKDALPWLYSSVVYRNHPLFETDMRRLLMSLTPLGQQYHMHKKKLAQGLESLSEKTTLQQFCKTLQAGLSVAWIREYQTMPSLQLLDLHEGITPSALAPQINALIEKKVKSSDNEVIALDTVTDITAFLETILSTTHPLDESEPKPVDLATVDEFFLKWVGFNKD